MEEKTFKATLVFGPSKKPHIPRNSPGVWRRLDPQELLKRYEKKLNLK